MRNYLAELIGAFFLVLTIGCTGISTGPGIIPPLAIGSALMVMIYAGGHVSGAHYNPAVTLGVFLRGAMPARDVVPYVLAQIVGAVAASAVVLFFKTGEMVTAFTPRLAPGFVAEFLFTFALVYVVLNVATAKATSGNSYFGIAIGFTVLAGAFSVGDVSGGAFNPAVAVGAMSMGMLPWPLLWLYAAAEFLGAAAAAAAFRALHAAEG